MSGDRLGEAFPYYDAMNFSTDERHNESLQLLRETAEYLKRMPVVPVTRAFIARIEEHLQAPTARLVLQRSFSRTGTTYSPGGVPLYTARLVGNELLIHAHQPHTILPVKEPLKVTLSLDEDPQIQTSQS